MRKLFNYGVASFGIAAGIVAIWLGESLSTEWAELGTVSVGAVVAMILGVAAALSTPLALRRVGSSDAGDPPFCARPAYWRVVAVVLFVFWLAVIFGSRRGQLERFLLHGLGFLLAHRVALCFPSILRRMTAALESNPLLRRVERVAFAMAVSCVLIEGTLQLTTRMFAFPCPRVGAITPFSHKLQRPIFGFTPNPLGYNDEPFVEQRSDTLRIAAIGDSFFVGHVPRPFGVIGMTEERLQKAPGAVEIYNFGINGNSPVEYAEVLRLEAARYRPDVVLVGVYIGNDIREGYPENTPLHKDWYAFQQTGEWIAASLRDRDALSEGEFVDLTRETRLEPEFWNDVEHLPSTMTRERFIRHIAVHLETCRRTPSHAIERGYQEVVASIEDMASQCRELGAVLVVLVCPDQVQVSKDILDEVASTFHLVAEDFDLEQPDKRLIAACDRLGLTSIDVLPALRGARRSDLYQPNDTHWSAPGNAIVADVVASALTPILEGLRKTGPR